jgi:O-antigen ligase
LYCGKILNFLATFLGFILFISAMRFWQFDLDFVRISAAEAAALLFNFFALIYFLFAGRTLLPRGIPRRFVLWNICLFSMAMASAAFIDWNLELAGDQYFKNLSSQFAQLVFLVFMVLVLIELGQRRTHQLLRVYMSAAILSGLWCVTEVFLASHDIELNRITFGAISTYRDEIAFTFEWDAFFRATGFAGVNAQATYLMSVIPLLLVCRPFEREWLNLFGISSCLLGIALTMSKNGFFCLIISLAFLLFCKPALLGRWARGILIAVIPLVVAADLFWQYVVPLFNTRINVDTFTLSQLFSGRKDIYAATLEAVLSQPWGYGLGQFFVHISGTDTIDLTPVVLTLEVNTAAARGLFANLHNNWLNWTFEFGFAGGLLYLWFYVWILRTMMKTQTALAWASAASLLGLMLASCFNQTINQFSVQVFIVLTTIAVHFEAVSVRETHSAHDKRRFAVGRRFPVTHTDERPLSA